jgi:hypothetical protein
MTCIVAVVRRARSMASPPPIEQMKIEGSEVAVSKSYHPSKTREHEFAGDLDLVAISEVREGINYR